MNEPVNGEVMAIIQTQNEKSHDVQNNDEKKIGNHFDEIMVCGSVYVTRDFI